MIGIPGTRIVKGWEIIVSVDLAPVRRTGTRPPCGRALCEFQGTQWKFAETGFDRRFSGRAPVAAR
jgi:hypothetical protein